MNTLTYNPDIIIEKPQTTFIYNPDDLKTLYLLKKKSQNTIEINPNTLQYNNPNSLTYKGMSYKYADNIDKELLRCVCNIAIDDYEFIYKKEDKNTGIYDIKIADVGKIDKYIYDIIISDTGKIDIGEYLLLHKNGGRYIKLGSNTSITFNEVKKYLFNCANLPILMPVFFAIPHPYSCSNPTLSSAPPPTFIPTFIPVSIVNDIFVTNSDIFYPNVNQNVFRETI